MSLFGKLIGNAPGGGSSIGGVIGSGTEGSVSFLGAGGVLAQDNANFYRSSSLFRVALSETQTDGAFRFKFAGWNGSGYTTGLVLESTDPLAYYGTHILLKNSAYNTTGVIAVNTPNGVSISSRSNGVVHGFNAVSYSIGAFSDIAANPAFRLTVNTSPQAGQAITLAASQTADAFQVFANDGTTKLFAINQAGSPMTKANAAPADATINSNECYIWFDSTAGTASINFKGKNSSGTVVTATLPLT